MKQQADLVRSSCDPALNLRFSLYTICFRQRSAVSRAVPAEPLTITLLSCRVTPLTASATAEFGTSRIMSTPSRSIHWRANQKRFI